MNRSSKVEVVPASTRHIGWIANNIREEDLRECEAMGRSPKQAMRQGVLTSTRSWTALVDGKPHAMFGVVIDSALSRKATPWFLGTDEVYRHGREMLSWGPRFLAEMGDSRWHLSNLVSASNGRAIRLLKRWGFTVGEDEVIVRGVPFLQFEKAIG